ncbi:MAG: type II toxin-antitoxin system PemK/MazF family toxin [Nanoarchaeota archaeon]
MERFVKGDVVVLDFPFSNLLQVKRRPALIIKVPKGEDVIACQITGDSYEKSVEIQLEKIDFQEGNLNRKSYLRLDKIFSVEKSLIKYKIGRLKPEKFNEILEKICNFLKN